MNDSKLTVLDILMLSYAPKFHTGENEFQQFWKYKYNANPYELLTKLLNNDFIEIDSISNSLKHKTTNELKFILNNCGMKTSGRKKELIDRLTSNFSEEQILTYIPEQYYCLTSLGQDVLKNNPNIIFAHQHSEFELDIYSVPPDGDIYEYILHQIECKEVDYIYYNNCGLYRNCIAQRAKLEQIKGNSLSELSLYFKIFYIDISGLRNGVEPKKLFPIKKYILDSWSDPTKSLATGNIERINLLTQKMNLKYEDVSSICKNVIENTHLPFHLYDNNDALNIILQRLYGTIRVSTLSTV